MACLPSEVVFLKGHGLSRCPCQQWLWFLIFVPQCVPAHQQGQRAIYLALASELRLNSVATLQFLLTSLIMLISLEQTGLLLRLEGSSLSEKAPQLEKKVLRLVLAAVFLCSSPPSALRWYIGIIRKTSCFFSPAAIEQVARPYRPSWRVFAEFLPRANSSSPWAALLFAAHAFGSSCSISINS